DPAGRRPRGRGAARPVPGLTRGTGSRRRSRLAMLTPVGPPFLDGEGRPVSLIDPVGTVVPAEVPTHWYNLAADLPQPVPPALHPGTREPLGPEDLAPLFPMALIAQEVSQERYIEIPQ